MRLPRDENPNPVPRPQGGVEEAITINRALELLKLRVADLYQIITQHENRIAINEDQWHTIGSLCDQSEAVTRRLNVQEEGLIADKKIIVDNKYQIIELKDKINVKNGNNDLHNIKKNIMYLWLLIGFLIIIIIFK